jgi:hypothetical protein
MRIITIDLPSNATADAIIAKDAEMIAAAEGIPGSTTTKAEGDHLTDTLNYTPAFTTNRTSSLIYEVKAEIVKAAGMSNDVLSQLGLMIWTNK